MPTLLKMCTYEGGVNNDPVLITDTGNGDTPTTVSGAGTIKYTTAWSAHGTKSCEISTVAAAQAFAVWTHAKQATGNYEIYVQTPASFTVTPTIFRLRDGSTQNLRGRWDSTGHLQLLNTGSSLITGATSVDAMAPSTAYRITISCTPGASGSAGAAVASFRPDIDGTTAPDVNKTVSVSGQDLGSTSGCSELAVGQFASVANVPAWRHDDPRMGFGGDLGPSALTLVPTAATMAFSGSAASLNLSLAPSAPAVSLAAGAASLNLSLAPIAATWTLAAGQPRLDQRLTPAAAAAAFTAAQPAPALRLTPLAATLSLAGVSPGLATMLSPAAATMAFSGAQPALRMTLTPLAASVAFSAPDAVLQVSGGGFTPDHQSVITTTSRASTITSSATRSAIAVAARSSSIEVS